MSEDINRRQFLRAAFLFGGAAVASRLLLGVEAKNTNPDHDDFCDPNQIGKSFEDNEGRVFTCVDGGNWIQQGEDPGIIYGSDGYIYKRVGDIPGQYPETYKFSHWAGKKQLNEETGKEVRNACFGTVEGLGCDMTYEVSGKWLDNSSK